MSVKGSLRLPRLPVPDLRKTLEGYLRSVQPVLVADEHNGGPDFATALKRQQSLVDEFLAGPAQRAQLRLMALDRTSPHNWLDDNFWMKKTYHQWRAPLLINSNWWLTFVNDPAVPADVVADSGEGLTPWQVRRAAHLIHGILEFRHRVYSHTKYSDNTTTGRWMRYSVSRIFNQCRVPERFCDKLSEPPPAESPWVSTITVLVHDFYYALCVVDSVTGAPFHVDEIERGLRDVVSDVLHRKRTGELPLELGVLTADERDNWSQNYLNLSTASNRNRRSFDAIHQSLFVVSLDHWPAPSVPTDERIKDLPLTYEILPSSPEPPISQSPKSLPNFCPTVPSDLLAHQYAIRSSPLALNRWFDKPLSLIVERTTRAGAMGEHSPVDALVPSIVCEWAVAGTHGISLRGGLADVPFRDDSYLGGKCELEDLGSGPGSRWIRLNFDPLSSTKGAIEETKALVQTLIANSDHEVSYFEDWGGEEMKRVSSYQADAFVQLALQLAYYRMHGRPAPVYETALTRSFQHGRTETIRSFTMESYTFMAASSEWKRESSNRNKPPPELYPLLRSALKAHSSLTRAAITGRGIDRHLLGLQCVSRDDMAWLDIIVEAQRMSLNQDTASRDTITFGPGLVKTSSTLFEDATFKKSQEWILSTSGLSEGWWFRGTGFGSPYEDGYGINYLIGPHCVKFCVESKHSCPTTSTRKFIQHLTAALRDIRDICLSAKESGKDGGPVSVTSEIAGADGAQPRCALTDPTSLKTGQQGGESVLAKSRL